MHRKGNRYKGYFKRRSSCPKSLIVNEQALVASISISKNLKCYSIFKQTQHGFGTVCGILSKKDINKILRTKDLSYLLSGKCNCKPSQHVLPGKKIYITSDMVSLN